MLWVKGFNGGCQCCDFSTSELLLDGTSARSCPIPPLLQSRMTESQYHSALDQFNSVIRKYYPPWMVSTIVLVGAVCPILVMVAIQSWVPSSSSSDQDLDPINGNFSSSDGPLFVAWVVMPIVLLFVVFVQCLHHPAVDRRMKQSCEEVTQANPGTAWRFE